MEKQWGSLSYFPKATQWPNTYLRPHQRTAADKEISTLQNETRRSGEPHRNVRTQSMPKGRALCAKDGSACTSVRLMKVQGWVKNEEIEEQTFMLFSPPVLSQNYTNARTHTPLHMLYWHCSSFSKLSQEGKTTPPKWLAGRGIMFLHSRTHYLPTTCK